MFSPRSYLFAQQSSSSPSPSSSTPPPPPRPREPPREQQSPPRKGGKHDKPSSSRLPHPPSPSSRPAKASPDASPPRPITPSTPVVIPMRSTRDHAQVQRPHLNAGRRAPHGRRGPGPVHSPDAIPPSVAALLALTSIPPQKYTGSMRKRLGAGQRLTVDALLEHQDVSEKEFSMSLSKSPLDFLLSPPDELDQDSLVGSGPGYESLMSARTVSSESMPSLDEEYVNELSPSPNSVVTPGSRGRRSLPSRRREPVTLNPESQDDHPLSPELDMDLDGMDFRVFQPPRVHRKLPPPGMGSPGRKSAFKSNLTASLKALRLAAKSFSSMTTPMLTPDDFLTRSILSIDPRVPFTDERMPPRLEDTPTAALRRYLNPTTNAPIEAHVPPSLAQTAGPVSTTASIQMQTYKVSRGSKSTSPSVISRRTLVTTEEEVREVMAGPVARQRDVRENSDFIRVAVMEMAMRRNGKLDEHKAGRARWVLPPRIPPSKPYEVGEDGVPLRWVAVPS